MFIKENVEPIVEDGHVDVASAKRQCKTIIEDAQAIMSALNSMDNEGSLPTWWTNKLAVASNSMNKMNDYISNPTEMKEEVDKDKLLKALKKKLSDEGGAAGMKPLKDVAKEMGVDLTPEMLKGMDGIKQHRDGDYILEAVKYPHMMYDPKTGKGVEAKSPEDHEKYAKMGYTHDKPEGMEEVRDPSKSGGTGYDLYHKDFSSAMKHAYDYAKKKLGVDIDPKEIDNKVASGPRKPSKGKTNKYRLMGKDGKKGVQIQVANLDDKKFELNMYKESVELDEAKKISPMPDRIVKGDYYFKDDNMTNNLAKAKEFQKKYGGKLRTNRADVRVYYVRNPDKIDAMIASYDPKNEEVELDEATLTFEADPTTAKRVKSVGDDNNVSFTMKGKSVILKGSERDILRVMYKMKFPANVYAPGKIKEDVELQESPMVTFTVPNVTSDMASKLERLAKKNDVEYSRKGRTVVLKGKRMDVTSIRTKMGLAQTNLKMIPVKEEVELDEKFDVIVTGDIDKNQKQIERELKTYKGKYAGAVEDDGVMFTFTDQRKADGFKAAIKRQTNDVFAEDIELDEKKDEPPFDVSKADYKGAAKELTQYAMTKGGVDKKDFLGFANRMSAIANKKSPRVTAKFARDLQDLDTDVREVVIRIMRNNGIKVTMAGRGLKIEGVGAELTAIQRLRAVMETKVPVTKSKQSLTVGQSIMEKAIARVREAEGEKMTDAEMKKREEIVKELKKKEDEFKERYGDKYKEVMYATATKMAMGKN